MNEYTPSNWVIVKTPHCHKVLAGWRGGYLDGDDWRMNSGITKIDFDDEHYYFYGETGSCYKCKTDRYGLELNICGIAAQLQERGCKILNIKEISEIEL